MLALYCLLYKYFATAENLLSYLSYSKKAYKNYLFITFETYGKNHWN